VTQIEIMQLNNMSDASKLKAGQKIKIKPKS
jgi:LysM repeat protein